MNALILNLLRKFAREWQRKNNTYIRCFTDTADQQRYTASHINVSEITTEEFFLLNVYLYLLWKNRKIKYQEQR